MPGARRRFRLNDAVLRGVLVGAVVATMLSACGGGESDEAQDADAAETSAAESDGPSTDVPVAEETTAEPVVEDGTAGQGRSATWQYANDEGYSYDLTITVFDPVSSGTNGDDEIGSVCGFDPELDIAVPGVLTAKATTEGFDTKMRAAFIIEHIAGDYTGNGTPPTRDDDRVGVEQYFTSDPTCRQYSSTNYWGYAQPPAASVVWGDPVATGSTVRSRFTVIVRNYISPRTPDGDAALLDWITIRPMATAEGRVGESDTFMDVNGTHLSRSKRGLTLAGAEVE